VAAVAGHWISALLDSDLSFFDACQSAVDRCGAK
jgi:hypothetical protein